MTNDRKKKRRTARRADGGCPICGSAVDGRYRPFCSRRCADLDLGHWLNEDYRIPTQEAPPDAEHPGEDDR